MSGKKDSQRSVGDFNVHRNKHTHTQWDRESHCDGVDVIGVRSVSEAAENQSLIS